MAKKKKTPPPNDSPNESPSQVPNEAESTASALATPAAEHEAFRETGSQTGGNSNPDETDRPATRPPSDGITAPVSVVGIGASAGGVEVLQEFFGKMPNDSGLAFVVVMHLSPEHESSLAQILQRKTEMSVVQVTSSVKVEPNHVYVIPPNKHLTMHDSMIVLSEGQQSQGRRVAIDLFFRTLAEQYGQRSACVILSGTDSDGVIGLKHIKAQGGVTIAQEPSEASHDSMPRSAIETGMVDWILPVEQIPARLIDYARNEKAMRLPREKDDNLVGTLPDLAPRGPGGPLISIQTDDPEDETALHRVLTFLRTQTGHDFTHYKRATVLRRIARRLQVNQLESIPQYLDFMRTHTNEPRALLNDLLIGVTHFFRDQTAWNTLNGYIPQLFAGKGSSAQLRVWVPGCATGEEAYSVAILLLEYAYRLENPPAIQVFATDLDDDSIKSAREGMFPYTIEADVSQDRLRRYFFQQHGHFRIKKEVRELVLFAEHDILRDSPFSRLDLITCRNLLIYLKPDAQHRVMDIFHFALRPGGLLFLGGSENVEETHSLFAALDKKHRIYVRRAVPRPPVVHLQPYMPRPVTIPHLPRLASPIIEQEFTPPTKDGSDGQPSASEAISFPPSHPQFQTLSELHVKLLEQYSPPSVIVDENYDILHMSIRAGDYLHFVGGEPSANLLKLVDDSLRVELRTALFRASQSNENVSVRDLHVRRENTAKLLNLHVRPVSLAGEPSAWVQRPSSADKFFLVVFDETQSDGAPPSAAEVEEEQKHDEVTIHLENEIRQLRAQLHSTVQQYEAANEELKASNEELQAMNEELRSATEELETSKEELQSINEELTTVNSELKSNVDELGRSNSDLQNLMASTDIGTIFLDRHFRIKRFTPRVQELFNLIPSDVGRPLSDITGKLRYPELLHDAERVLRDLGKFEREVKRGDNGWFLARLSPYRTVEEKIDGVVVSFIDIAELKRAEDQLRSNMDELQRFNRVAVGRETRMVELKKEINALCAKVGEPARYSLEFENSEEQASK